MGISDLALAPLETIAVSLIVLWLLGLVSSATMGGFIHISLGDRYHPDRAAAHSRLTP